MASTHAEAFAGVDMVAVVDVDPNRALRLPR